MGALAPDILATHYQNELAQHPENAHAIQAAASASGIQPNLTLEPGPAAKNTAPETQMKGPPKPGMNPAATTEPNPAQGRLFESRARPQPGEEYKGPDGRPVRAMSIDQLPERTAANKVPGVSRGEALATNALLRTIGKRVQIFEGNTAFYDEKDPNTIHIGNQMKDPILATVGHEIKHAIDVHFPRLSRFFDRELAKHVTPEMREQFRQETHTPEEKAATKPGELHPDYGMNEFSADAFGAMFKNKDFFTDVFRAVQMQRGIEDKFPGTIGKVGAFVVRLTRTMMSGLRAPVTGERFASVESLRSVQRLHDRAVVAMARYYRESQMTARQAEAERMQAAHEVSRIPLYTKSVELHPSITRRENGKPNGNQGARPGEGVGPTARGPAQSAALAADRGQGPQGIGGEPRGAEERTAAGAEAKALAGSPPMNKPSAAIRQVAEQYMRDSGLPYSPPTRYAKVDVNRARLIARAYSDMAHAPNDPEVKASYDALARETVAQYDAMVRAGVKVDFMKPGENAYPNPRDAIADIQNNNHLSIFPTEEGHGMEGQPDRSDNPLLADSGRTIGGRPATVNDIFRAVHDYFGHAKEGVGFRADGEENAWRVHSSMYSDLARRAMTSETRGQNSWVNYGPFGDKNRTATQEGTHYAEQKAGLMPPWVSEEGKFESRGPQVNASGESAASKEAINRMRQEEAEGIKRGVIDARTGEWRPLPMADRVDYQAKPYEIYAKEHLDGRIEPIDIGEKVGNYEGAIARFKQRNPDGAPADLYRGGLEVQESRAAQTSQLSKPINDMHDGKDLPDLKTKKAVAVYLDERARKLLRGMDLTEDTPENRTALAGALHAEATRALAKEGHAAEWYRQALEGAMHEAARAYPEIRDNPRHEFAFKSALAITSNGTSIPDNVRMAFDAYEHYRQTGDLADDVQGGGPRTRAIQGSLRYFNELKRSLGEDELRNTLMREMPVRDIERAFGLSLKELKDQNVYGSSVFGPKIGGGFLPNLMGHYDPLTIDRWLMRTWGRLTGDLVDPNPGNESGMRDSPRSGGQRAYIRGTMREALDVLQADNPNLNMAGLQATLWYPEKELYKAFGVRGPEPTDYEQEIRKYVDLNHPDSGPAIRPERGGGRAAGEGGAPESFAPEGARTVSADEFLRESRAANGSWGARNPVDAIREDPERGLRQPGWGVFTATREDQGPHSSPENVENNHRLEGELMQRGLPYERVAGSYKGIDQGPNFLVAADRGTLHGLRAKYGQESILTHLGLEYGDGTIHPADHSKNLFHPEAEKQENYSTLSNGKTFSMGIDFDRSVEMPPTLSAREEQARAERQRMLESEAWDSRAAQTKVRQEWDNYSDINPATMNTLKKVGLVVDQPTLKKRVLGAMANWDERAIQGMVDDFRPLMHIDPDQKISTAYMMAKLSRGYNGTVEALLRYGKIFLNNGAPDVDTKDPSGGFAKVLSNLKGEEQRALAWISGQRAERLHANGLEHLMDPADISNLKNLDQGKMADGSDRAPVYEKFLRDLTDYNNAALDMAEHSGLITRDVAQLFRDHPYVPFYRVQEDIGKGVLSPFSKTGLTDQKAWHRLKGGTNPLNADLLNNVLSNWAHIFQSSAKNRAALATVDTLLKHHTDVIEHIPPGMDVPKGSFQVMRDGIGERYLIHDPLLATAVSSFNYVSPDWMKVLTKPKQLLTAGVTLSPFFRVRIAIREALASLIQSPIGTNPVKNIMQGWKNTDTKSAIFASTLASGGQIRFGQSERSVGTLKMARKLTNVVADDGVVSMLGRQISTLWDAYHELGNKTENFNRTALYEQLRNKINPETGNNYTHLEAAFAARDLLDFSAGGSWPIIKFLTGAVPFMNARAQGLYSIGKTFAGDPHGKMSLQNKVTAVTMAACAGSVALMLANQDEDWWKNRTQQDRDAYWAFKIGNTIYRVPKPFEMGAAATMAERTWELATQKDMTLAKYGSNFAQTVENSLSFNPMPQTIKPLYAVYANKDPMTQFPIETGAEQKLLPAERYDENTTRVARFLGGLGIPDPVALSMATYKPLDPKQIDYLIGGYTSSVGLFAAGILDYADAALYGNKKPAMTAKQLTGSFVSEVPESASRYVQEMHQHLEGIQEAWASYQDAVKRGDRERVQGIVAEHGAELREHEVAGEVEKQMTAINKMLQRAEASTLPPDEKRTMIDRLQQQKNQLARRFQEATQH